MTNLRLNNIVIFFGLLTVITSCSVFKKSEGKIIKGNYEVIKIEKVNNSTSQLVCIVYDKQKNVPISNASVQVNELKVGGFTKNDGTLDLDIPAGKYTITVANVGNTTIQTNLINFKPNTKTKINFKLGTTIIH